MRRITLMAGIQLICLLSPLCLHAAAKHSAAGRVFDSYSRELLMDVQIDVLAKADSSAIATTFTVEGVTAFNLQCNIFLDSIPDAGAILYLTKEGYYPKYFTLPKIGAQERLIELQPILMTRIPFFKPRELNEVTVTASRIKMVVHGDTISYNADAFNLAQGSMLDGLIDQLPGAQLKSDGKIYINGKFVNELLVNGDNFFKGDPKIALENLPAYMVNDISVYHRNDLRENKPLDDLPLVMDVKLKKQYQTGWIANAEGGYGTAHRYLGRLFAMMFTRDSRLSIVGNVNNTNDDRKPGQTDNWNPDWQAAGRATIASAGVDYLWNSRMRTWKVEANLMAHHKKSDITSIGNSENYLAGGNLLGTRQNSQTGKEWRITTDNKVSFHVPRFWLNVKPTALFAREKAWSSASSTTADSYGHMLNSLDEDAATYRRSRQAGAELDGRWQLPASLSTLVFNAGVDWKDRQLETSTSRQLIFQQHPEQNELSRPLELMPERKLEANAKVRYSVNYNVSSYFHGDVDFSYAYRHKHVNSTRDYFLRQDPANIVLPSVTDATSHAGFIPTNSFTYTLNDDCHTLQAAWTNWFPHLQGQTYQPHIVASIALSYAPGAIDYLQGGTKYLANRRQWYAEPKLNFSIDNIGAISYKYTADLPLLPDLLEVTDAANPLYIYRGNSDLKTTRMHELWLNVFRLFKKGPGLEVTYRKYENLIAKSAVYDMTTGITTYRPVNVDGNWELSGNLRYYGSFGSTKRWGLESATRAYYQNSVDLIGTDLSTVRNLNVAENLKLTFKIMPGMEISANGKAEWRKVTSPMEGFNTISAVDFDYGIIFRAVKLPWDISVTTDLMMHSRRGYADPRLNTNDLVWNARLAKSILNGNLTFALDGFDILGNLSNVRLTMNSQGRTETRYNTLPRYAMLHIIYRLNLQPKKR